MALRYHLTFIDTFPATESFHRATSCPAPELTPGMSEASFQQHEAEKTEHVKALAGRVEERIFFWAVGFWLD